MMTILQAILQAKWQADVMRVVAAAWLAASFWLPLWAVTAHADDCAPVATFFGRLICAEDLEAMNEDMPEMTEDILQQMHESGLDPDDIATAQNLVNLEQIIWQIGLEERYSSEALQPAREDIETVRRFIRSQTARHYEENKQAVADINARLEDPSLTESERHDLKNLAARILLNIGLYDQKTSHRDSMPPEFADLLAEAERNMIEKMLAEWLSDKYLYEDFGGAVIMDETQIKPIGAYQDFVDWLRTEGALTIKDPAYHTLFTAITDADTHTGENRPLDHEAARDYFSSPLWQFKAPAQ